MAIGDHITRVPRLRTTVNLVDTENGVIDVIGHDGAARRIGINSMPATFRWPIEGEEWMIEEQNGQWILGERVRSLNPDDQAIDLSMGQPGDVILDVGITNKIIAAKLTLTTPPGLPDETILHTVPRKYTEVIGDGTSTLIPVTHLLHTKGVVWSIVENLTANPEPVSNDVVTQVHEDFLILEFATPPLVDEFLVTVIG